MIDVDGGGAVTWTVAATRAWTDASSWSAAPAIAPVESVTEPRASTAAAMRLASHSGAGARPVAATSRRRTLRTTAASSGPQQAAQATQATTARPSNPL